MTDDQPAGRGPYAARPLPPGWADTLGGAMRAARVAAGLSGTALATQLGWNTRSGKVRVSRIESGAQIPTYRDIAAWAEAAGVTADTATRWRELSDARRNAKDKRRHAPTAQVLPRAHQLHMTRQMLKIIADTAALLDTMIVEQLLTIGEDPDAGD